MAPSSSSSSLSPPFPPLHPPHFTPIQESEREGNEDEEFQDRSSYRGTTPSDCTDGRDIGYGHRPTPLHEKRSARKRTESGDGEDRGVSCNKCRPSNREKITVVPVDNSGISRLSTASPNGLLKSIFSSLVKKSPKLSDGSPAITSREDQWEIAAAEISHKLIQATRKRDEAVLEASKLKSSVSELEKKLNKLEIYCENLKSGLEICSGNSQIDTNKPRLNTNFISIGDRDTVIDHFLVSVSESRSSIRLLSRSLTLQLRQMGSKIYERIALVLQPHDIKISYTRNPRGLIVYLEALLNRAFFEDFESIGFRRSGPNRILNPIDRCEFNFSSFRRLQGLTWEEVLSKGTRFFSEDFSGFCDRKMSEIVALFGWNRAWPEPLLQAFFGASRSVWIVHLLANSVHPGLPVFRVDKGSGFDPVYMEDMGGDKARKLVPGMVRIMVAPGFYVYENVVKCKVLCRYSNSNGGPSYTTEMGPCPSPI